MGHTVHGSSIYVAVILDQHRAAAPCPVAVNALQCFCIGSGKGLGVNMVVAAPAFDRKDFACPAVLDLKGGPLRNGVLSAVKPVKLFGFATGGGRFLRIRAVQLFQSGGVDFAGLLQVVPLLEFPDCVFRAVAVIPVVFSTSLIIVIAMTRAGFVPVSSASFL